MLNCIVNNMRLQRLTENPKKKLNSSISSFCNIPIHCLLKVYGFHDLAGNLIAKYLTNRRQLVKFIGNKTELMVSNSELPLGPLLNDFRDNLTQT